MRDTGMLHQKRLSAGHKMQGNVHKEPYIHSFIRADSLHFLSTTIEPIYGRVTVHDYISVSDPRKYHAPRMNLHYSAQLR